MTIYDYLYVDLQKIISLYSQMTGGVVEVIERTNERSTSTDNKRNYDFKVFKHDAGGTDVDLEGSRATVKPHHALLKELENALREQGYLLDLTDPAISRSFKTAEMRAQLKGAFCIKATGRSSRRL